MRRLLAGLLLIWEPVNFAGEAFGVLPTIAYRGWLAAAELGVHALTAALSATAGLALWNAVPDDRKIASAAVVACAARVVQSTYWSVLPDNSAPGEAPLRVGVAALTAMLALLALRLVSPSPDPPGPNPEPRETVKP